MLLSELLKKHHIIALDTATFIYHFEKDNPFFEATSVLFRNIQSHQIEGITSVVTLAEILVRPMKIKDIEIIEDYKIILNNFPNLTILNIDQNIAILAAELRAKYKIKLLDALQIAGGLIKEATLFITNNKKLKLVQEIKVVTLRDLIYHGKH